MLSVNRNETVVNEPYPGYTQDMAMLAEFEERQAHYQKVLDEARAVNAQNAPLCDLIRGWQAEKRAADELAAQLFTSSGLPVSLIK